MAGRGLSSPHQTTTSSIDCVEDNEKQKRCHELRDSEGKAGGLQKECRVAGSRPFLRSARTVGFFRPFFRRRRLSSGGYLAKKEPLRQERPRERKLTSGEDVPDGVARKKLRRQERCPESTADGDVADVEETKKSFHQALEYTPGIQAHLHSTHAKWKCRFHINSNISTFFSGLRSLSQWLVSVLKCSSCTSPDSTLASGGHVDDDETKPGHKKPEEARRYQLSIIQLKRKNRLSGDISIIGGQVRADSTDLIPTVIQRPDQNAVSDAHVQTGGVPAVDFSTTDSEAVAEGTINLELEGPRETAIVLGGLSLLNYEHIVLSVCPALPREL